MSLTLADTLSRINIISDKGRDVTNGIISYPPLKKLDSLSTLLLLCCSQPYFKVFEKAILIDGYPKQIEHIILKKSKNYVVDS